MALKSKILGWAKELLFALVLMIVFANVVSYFKRPDLQSKTLPNIAATTIDGKDIFFQKLSGKLLVIHFWATWCPTCKLEIANFEKLSKEAQVITIAVNSGDHEKIKAFMRERDLSFDVINDDEGKIASHFAINAFPTTFIYDKEGKIAFSEVGYTSTWGLKLRLWLTQAN